MEGRDGLRKQRLPRKKEAGGFTQSLRCSSVTRPAPFPRGTLPSQKITPALVDFDLLLGFRKGAGRTLDVRPSHFRGFALSCCFRQLGKPAAILFLIMKLFRLLRISLPLLLVSLIWLNRDSTKSDSGREKYSDRRVKVSGNRGDDTAVIFSKAPEEFQGWVESYHEDPKAADLEEGVALAKARRTVLKRAIELDPERAV
jgi:hypothetical protein